MVLSFSVENFRSLKELQTLRMDARAIKPKYTYLEETAIPVMHGVSGLAAKVIYGPNAGGKSNLIRAMAVFLNVCQKSFAAPETLEQIVPYLLSSATEKEPSLFEIEVSLADRIYRYGFVADAKIIREEWLFVKLKGKEYTLYERDGKTVNFNKSRFKGGEKLLSVLGKGTSVLRDNALFLAVAASFNHPIAKDVYTALSSVRVIGRVMDKAVIQEARDALKNEEMRRASQEFLLQIGIKAREIVYWDADTLSSFGFEGGTNEIMDKLPHPQSIGFVHDSYDADGNLEKPMSWPVENGESVGTQKLLWLAPYIIDSVRNGTTLVVDEFEASLHTEFSRRIIELYGFRQTNPHHAQLIVATHDTNLLHPQILRRDQIAFVEKDARGASRVYSLADIRKVRNDESFERNYLVGKYGAIPDTERLKVAS